MEQMVKSWFDAWFWVPYIMQHLGAPDLLCMVAFFGGSVGIPAFVLWLVRKPIFWVIDISPFGWLTRQLWVTTTTTHPDGTRTVEKTKVPTGSYDDWLLWHLGLIESPAKKP